MAESVPPTSDCYNARERHTTIVGGPNLNVTFPHNFNHRVIIIIIYVVLIFFSMLRHRFEAIIAQVCGPVVSLGLVSPGAATDGVTLFLLKELTTFS